MADHFENEYHEGYALIRMVSRFNYRTNREFRMRWNEIVNKGIFRIILDMRDIDQMDSSGMGSVVMLKSFLDLHQGKLVLINGKNDICGLFEITGLKNLIQYVDDPEEARKFIVS